MCRLLSLLEFIYCRCNHTGHAGALSSSLAGLVPPSPHPLRAFKRPSSALCRPSVASSSRPAGTTTTSSASRLPQSHGSACPVLGRTSRLCCPTGGRRGVAAAPRSAHAAMDQEAVTTCSCGREMASTTGEIMTQPYLMGRPIAAGLKR